MSKQPSCDKNGVAFSGIKSYKIKSDDKGMIDCYYVDNYNYNQFNDDNQGRIQSLERGGAPC